MKLKVDENLPVSVARRLAALGFDVHTVLDESLGGASDDQLWAAAQLEGRFLITCDLDFSDARRFAPGSHHGVLVVRLPDSEHWRAADHIAAWFAQPGVNEWQGCLVIGTLSKVRVIRGAEKPSPAKG